MVRVRLGRNGEANGTSTAEKLADLFQRKPGAARVRIELIEEDGRRLNLDPHLAGIYLRGCFEQPRHHHRERDYQRDHDQLQPHPGQRAPVDIGCLHLLWRDAAQIEQREAHPGGWQIGLP